MTAGCRAIILPDASERLPPGAFARARTRCTNTAVAIGCLRLADGNFGFASDGPRNRANALGPRYTSDTFSRVEKQQDTKRVFDSTFCPVSRYRSTPSAATPFLVHRRAGYEYGTGGAGWAGTARRERASEK
uniref:Uncharacterized protein n=1 Tax=Sipha flava TaxID=143950 RepID=A0A2S2QGT7_9HEMI